MTDTRTKIWTVVATVGLLFASVGLLATTSTGLTFEEMTGTGTSTPWAWARFAFVGKGEPGTRALMPASLPHPSEKLHGYGSYWKVSDLPLERMANYTNFLYTYHRAELGWPDEEDLQALRDAGIGALLKLDKQVVEDEFNETELRALKARIDTYKDVVWALCVIDEPYRPGRQPPLTEEELAALVDRVKAIFPDYTMYVNFLAPYYVEQATGEPFPGVPGNIDLISTDIYIHLQQTSGDEEYNMRVARNLSIILDRAQGRPVFYAAPAYGVIDDETTWPSPGQAQLDYDLYQEHGLVGLAWYFYEETSPGGDLWGSSYWPDLVSKHEEIGQMILSGGTSLVVPSIWLPLVANRHVPTLTAPPPLSGSVETLVLRVNLADASVACTEHELAESIFADANSVKAVYSESSRGALVISGEVATVNIGASTANGCAYEDWATLANEAATAAGYNLSDYDRFAYIMPRALTQDCPGGSFSVGGEWVWSLRCELPHVVAHELGHTFGMYHASTETDEYGDLSDPMGGGSNQPLTQVNAPHLDQMGWLPDTAIRDVIADGVYSIEATEVHPRVTSHPQILRLKKQDTDEYYYVSFRRAIGLDANLFPEYRDDVVSVHRFRGFGFAPGYGPPKTYLLALLAKGESFTDAPNGITVTTESIEGNVAAVRVRVTP